MSEQINKWEVVSRLITLQNNYNFFKNEWDADRLYREIAKLEIEIGKISGLEVVRCKDCKYWKPGDAKGGNSIEDLQVIGGCKWTICCRREMDFCSFGERKDSG
jgi:hypothetical protein